MRINRTGCIRNSFRFQNSKCIVSTSNASFMDSVILFCHASMHDKKDAPQLRRYGPLNGLHTIKKSLLDYSHELRGKSHTEQDLENDHVVLVQRYNFGLVWFLCLMVYQPLSVI